MIFLNKKLTESGIRKGVAIICDRYYMCTKTSVAPIMIEQEISKKEYTYQLSIIDRIEHISTK